MEAIGHLTTRQGAAPGGRFVVSPGVRAPWRVPAAGQSLMPRRFALLDPGEAHGGSHGGPQRVLEGALAALRSLARTAVDDVGPLGLPDSAAFASGVEELSRTLDYLQLVAAGQLHRVRQQEPAAGTGWTTGWGAETRADGSSDGPGSPEIEGGAAEASADVGNGSLAATSAVAGFREFRNTGEHLRSLLRISAAEARRRLALAEDLLPGRSLTGQRIQPRYGEVAAALACGSIASRPATTITMALDRVRPLCSRETAADMEHALTLTATENDADFLARIARRWTDAIDQDGAEPSEETLRHLQGAFLRRPKHGLQHVEIFATQDQYEHLLTVMNTATNPRTRTSGEPGPEDDAVEAGGGSAPANAPADGLPGGSGDDAASLDRRTRAQKLLDGLLGACKIALATGALPAAGGQRPQIMATIDHRDLLASVKEAGQLTFLGQSGQAGRADGSQQDTGSFAFTGPVPAATLRKIACDADIIPVVLGGEGQVLDIGRASRIFPAHIRKAITARDKGCAFPSCTMPAPWCEAHHITYWSRGGPSSADNGVLLCSHHHHLIHKEEWHIQVQTGVPWFIPPPHIDPRQQPRRNHYFQV
ncbi:HNH endonuclease signature motif containing protein [Arthrobacter sp. FW306-2-2C-D06B]|uniref:HNH endonuclease signature motif containing protein n=1 Tax=Arthrobacter sp. FW306-2-2C-D06B TaxID=2879618 RepID=UPI001F3B5AA1|nr:HNH endonuclease signature motif containing protein [Arthrobacter sp. FW306-2-2C-D06B]UKA60026.1 HNH endonuclease [Arthrobacter sp. FW306-2-2C-D06B]